MADITDILDSRLDEALRGGAAGAAVASETAAEVAPLVELGSALRGALRTGIPAHPPAAVRESLLARAQAIVKDAPARRSRSMRRLVLRPAALAAVLLTASAGTALAANAAGPDSILYPLKQELENARSLIAVQPLDRAAVKAGDAGKRLDEIQAMVNKGEPRFVGSLLAAYDSDMAQAQQLVSQAAADGENTSAVAGMIDATRARHDALLAQIAGKVPADVQSIINHEEQGQGQMKGDSPAGQDGQMDNGASTGGMSPGDSAPADGGASGAGNGGISGDGIGSGQMQGGSTAEPQEPAEPAEGGMKSGGQPGSHPAAPAPSQSGQPTDSGNVGSDSDSHTDGMSGQRNMSLSSGFGGSSFSASGMSAPRR
ncbi:MAG: DUF5667 domain-containing protein [Thermoleophilia bacterium]